MDLLKERLARSQAALGDCPPIPEDIVEHLEKMFPPRCYEGAETLENHLLYAGAAVLVQMLREELEEQRRDGAAQALVDAADDSVDLPLDQED